MQQVWRAQEAESLLGLDTFSEECSERWLWKSGQRSNHIGPSGQSKDLDFIISVTEALTWGLSSKGRPLFNFG